MPRGRKPAGEQALSIAERQARYRARPRAALARRGQELLDLQATYADWLATLPDALRASRTAEALDEAIADLDLIDLAECDPPRGYRRD